MSEISNYSTSQLENAGSQTATTSTSQSQDQINFSQTAQLFSQLQKLETSNPAEFKPVLTDGAAKLRSAASQTTDTAQASVLSELAARFTAAAGSGNLTALPPSSSSSSGTGLHSAPSRRHVHHAMGIVNAQTGTLELSSILGGVADAQIQI